MGFSVQLDWPTSATWGFFALMAAISAVAQTHPHIRRAFHRWRLDRRLAGNPYMQRDELREYEAAIDEDLARLDPAEVVKQSLLAATLAMLPVWLAERHLEDWWHAAIAVVGVAGVLVSIWRHLNDPPERRAEDSFRSPLVAFLAERDAVLGLAAAIGIVSLVALPVYLLF